MNNILTNNGLIKKLSSSELNSISFRKFNFIGEISIPNSTDNNNLNNHNYSFFEVFFRINYNEIPNPHHFF
jgi:hypothetical protein